MQWKEKPQIVPSYFCIYMYIIYIIFTYIYWLRLISLTDTSTNYKLKAKETTSKTT